MTADTIEIADPQSTSRTSIDLSAGTLDYDDTGGEGPTIVFLPGLMMDASLWEDVIGDVSREHR